MNQELDHVELRVQLEQTSVAMDEMLIGGSLKIVFYLFLPNSCLSCPLSPHVQYFLYIKGHLSYTLGWLGLLL